MNRKDMKDFFRALYAEPEQANSSSLLKESDDLKLKRKGVNDQALNIDAQFLTAIISRGMDILRNIWMTGEEIDKVYYMIDNNIPVTDIIAYLRKIESVGRQWEDVAGAAQHDLPPEEDEEAGDHSEEYKKMTDSFSPYDK